MMFMKPLLTQGRRVGSVRSGRLVQVVNTQDGTLATGTTVMPLDDTIPQNTEGDQYMSLAITPTNASNILEITVTWIGSHSAAGAVYGVGLFQDSTAAALAVGAASGGSGAIIPITFKHRMTAGTASATTFKVRAGGHLAGTTSFNGSGGVRRYGGVMASSITIKEIAA